MSHRGYNIGIRLVDEFLAKTKQGRCNTFRDAAESVARQALPMFLNVSAHVTNWNADGNECSLVRGRGNLVCVGVVGQGWRGRGCCQHSRAGLFASSNITAAASGTESGSSSRRFR